MYSVVPFYKKIILYSIEKLCLTYFYKAWYDKPSIQFNKFQSTVSVVYEQLWNAFEDTLGYQPLGGIKHDSRLLVGTDGITSTANQGMGLTSSEVSFASLMFQCIYQHILFCFAFYF